MSSGSVETVGSSGGRDVVQELGENIVHTFRLLGDLGITPSDFLNEYGEVVTSWHVGPRTRAGWVQELKDHANNGENEYLRVAYYLTERFGDDDEAWADWLTTSNTYLGDLPGAYIGGIAPHYIVDAMMWDRGEIGFYDWALRGL